MGSPATRSPANGTICPACLTGSGSPLTLTFNGFDGTGFTPTPTSGQLNSNAWETTGFSDGPLVFGGTFTTGDHARGSAATGGVTSGGVYAFDDGTDQAIWIQPTGGDWTPGTITLLVTNGTGGTITDLDIAYDLMVLNNGDRGNTFNCSYSIDNTTFIPIPALDYLSPETQDGMLSTIAQSATVSGIAIADGDSIFIRWESDDNLGTGSRDEFGLDDITLTGTVGVASAPEVNFTSAGQVVLESAGAVTIDLNLSAADTCAVQVSLGMGGTATNPMDFTFTSPDTVLFLSAGPTTASTTVTIIDDAMLESSETVILVLDSVFNCTVGATDTYTLTIDDNDQSIPVYPIGVVTADSDGDGVGDSLGVECELRGVVHGGDFNGGGSIQFTFIDPTGGIGLFSSNDFGYTVTEGDSVHVIGNISVFNGLTQISPDTVISISAGNALNTPAVVTTLNETTESELVRFNNATIIDPSQWTGTGSGFNVDITNGTDTITLRIDNDVDLYSLPAPTGVFDVIGLGGQFDNSPPATEGYQLLPRYQQDIIVIPLPGFSFTPTALFTNEAASTIFFEVSLATPFPTATSVEVNLGSTSTATSGDDFTGWNDTILNFPANATGPFALSLTIVDDNVAEATENIFLNLENPTGGPVLGDSVLNIQIEDNDYQAYPIDLVTADSNGDGLPDSIGVQCELRGIVHGTNQQNPSRINFAFIDNTGGIATFSNNTFGYTVTEGDEVIIRGNITQFNGLAQINPDTLVVVSTGNPINMPMVVDSLGEFTESEYIQLNCFRFVDPTQWPSGESANLQITNGTDTLIMRIDSDTEVDDFPIPASPFNVRGLGWQFDNSDPRTEGYQIIPQFISHFDALPQPEATFTTDTLVVSEADGSAFFTIDLNNGNEVEYTIDVEAGLTNTTATSGDDYTFTPISLDFDFCGNESATLELGIVDDSDLEGDEQVVISLSEMSGDVLLSTAELYVIIQDDETSGIPSLDKDMVSLFPNPANSYVRLQSSVRMESVQIWDMLGRKVAEQSVKGLESDLSLEALQAGMYSVKVFTAQGVWNGKLIRE